VDVEAGLSVCVSLWAGLVEICSPRQENIQKKIVFSEFFISLPIVFSDEITLSLLLSFLYQNKHLNNRCCKERIDCLESSYALIHPSVPQVFLLIDNE
jgi:hypothetical protein